MIICVLLQKKTILLNDMKRILFSVGLLLANLLGWAQSNYDYERLCMERLDRGVVAIPQADGRVAVSWRTLRSDKKGEPFDISHSVVEMTCSTKYVAVVSTVALRSGPTPLWAICQ